MSKIVGYTRVSSKDQLDSDSIEEQQGEILNRYSNAIIYSEQFTGMKKQGPIFNEVQRNLNTGDTLVICKLDRLVSNTIEGIELVQGLFEKGVSIHMLNVGLIENNVMGNFFLTTLLAITEMEKNTAIERNQNSILITNTRQGLKKGRPKVYTQEQLDDAIEMIRNRSYKEVSYITGMSMSTLFREVKKRKERG